MKIMYRIPTSVMLLAYKRYAAKLETICLRCGVEIDSKLFDIVLDETIKEWQSENKERKGD